MGDTTIPAAASTVLLDAAGQAQRPDRRALPRRFTLNSSPYIPSMLAGALGYTAPLAERLARIVDKLSREPIEDFRVDLFDDAATGQGSLNYFLRAMNSGAVSGEQAAALSGLTFDELRTGRWRAFSTTGEV